MSPTAHDKMGILGRSHKGNKANMDPLKRSANHNMVAN